MSTGRESPVRQPAMSCETRRFIRLKASGQGSADQERSSGRFLHRSERARAKDGSDPDHVMGWSYLNGAAHASQMIPESQGRCFLALSKVSIKLNLFAQGAASTNEFGLTPFSFADRVCEREDIRCGSQWN